MPFVCLADETYRKEAVLLVSGWVSLCARACVCVFVCVCK